MGILSYNCSLLVWIDFIVCFNANLIVFERIVVSKWEKCFILFNCNSFSYAREVYYVVALNICFFMGLYRIFFLFGHVFGLTKPKPTPQKEPPFTLLGIAVIDLAECNFWSTLYNWFARCVFFLQIFYNIFIFFSQHFWHSPYWRSL